MGSEVAQVGEKRRALVLGATGLLGYGITLELLKAGWTVRAIGKRNLPHSAFFPKEVEYICGDFYDEAFLRQSFIHVDKVFFFLSTTFPSSSTDSLRLEISRTIEGLDYLLRSMREAGIKDIVFPSSGGTVYGNMESGAARETDLLKPVSPYGVGKMICEQVLQFYSQFGISPTILRIGNVYGSPMVRTTTQGVIDVFVQKALRDEPAIVWGDALTSVRDYIFLDDLAEAVVRIANHESTGIEIYNLSSGVGTTLEEIIQTINRYTEKPLQVQYVQNDASSSIRRIVLDVSKIKEKTGWEPKFDINAGIAETFNRKQRMKEMI